jgi:hypothetical protein
LRGFCLAPFVTGARRAFCGLRLLVGELALSGLLGAGGLRGRGKFPAAVVAATWVQVHRSVVSRGQEGIARWWRRARCPPTPRGSMPPKAPHPGSGAAASSGRCLGPRAARHGMRSCVTASLSWAVAGRRGAGLSICQRIHARPPWRSAVGQLHRRLGVLPYPARPHASVLSGGGPQYRAWGLEAREGGPRPRFACSPVVSNGRSACPTTADDRGAEVVLHHCKQLPLAGGARASTPVSAHGTRE